MPVETSQKETKTRNALQHPLSHCKPRGVFARIPSLSPVPPFSSSGAPPPLLSSAVPAPSSPGLGPRPRFRRAGLALWAKQSSPPLPLRPRQKAPPETQPTPRRRRPQRLGFGGKEEPKKKKGAGRRRRPPPAGRRRPADSGRPAGSARSGGRICRLAGGTWGD